MNHKLDKLLAENYRKFDRNHDQLRDQLLCALPDMSGVEQTVETTRPRRMVFSARVRFALRTAIAAAAVFVIAFGVFAILNNGAVKPQAAWANALEQARHVQSVHFKLINPGSRDDSSVEMWWRRPDDFRMVFSDGTTLTGNRKERCIYNPMLKTLTLMDADGPSLAVPIMGELGELFFHDEYSLNGNWVKESKLISTKIIEYKGERCIKAVCETDKFRFEYIIDTREPLIYEVSQYDINNGRLRQHMVVLDVDQPMEEELFTVDPSGKKVIDRRLGVKSPAAKLPILNN